MGAYKYIKETLENQYKNRDETFRKRIALWRKEGNIIRVEHPTNISRARALGYKAKQGIYIVRVKIGKGMRKRRDPRAGRKPRHNYRYTSSLLSAQSIAEQRASRKNRNAEVLNSYWVGEDGQYKYFEVILADRNAKGLDKHTKQMVSQKGRAFRGLTSSTKKSRGLRSNKGLNKQRKGSKKKKQASLHLKL